MAFSSPQTGPLGRVTEGHPIIWSRMPRNPPLDPPDLDRRVLVVPTAAGDDGTLARAALSTEPDGVVIGTLGAGHLAPACSTCGREAAERIPVVAYCRPERGVILTSPTATRARSGTCAAPPMIPAGFLSPQAARMKLLAAWPRACRSKRSAGPSARTTADPSEERSPIGDRAEHRSMSSARQGADDLLPPGPLGGSSIGAEAAPGVALDLGGGAHGQCTGR